MKKKKKIKTRGSPSVSVLEGVACAPPYFLDIKSFTATAYPTQKRTRQLNSKYISNTKIRIRKKIHDRVSNLSGDLWPFSCKGCFLRVEPEKQE